jgi:hypothetical protein
MGDQKNLANVQDIVTYMRTSRSRDNISGNHVLAQENIEPGCEPNSVLMFCKLWALTKCSERNVRLPRMKTLWSGLASEYMKHSVSGNTSCHLHHCSLSQMVLLESRWKEQLEIFSFVIVFWGSVSS